MPKGDACLQVENFWHSGGKDIVRENVRFTIYASQADARELEGELAWEALPAAVTLRGSREQGKSYGGLSARFAPRQGTVPRASGELLSNDES